MCRQMQQRLTAEGLVEAARELEGFKRFKGFKGLKPGKRQA